MKSWRAIASGHSRSLIRAMQMGLTTPITPEHHTAPWVRAASISMAIADTPRYKHGNWSSLVVVAEEEAASWRSSRGWSRWDDGFWSRDGSWNAAVCSPGWRRARGFNDSSLLEWENSLACSFPPPFSVPSLELRTGVCTEYSVSRCEDCSIPCPKLVLSLLCRPPEPVGPLFASSFPRPCETMQQSRRYRYLIRYSATQITAAVAVEWVLWWVAAIRTLPVHADLGRWSSTSAHQCSPHREAATAKTKVIAVATQQPQHQQRSTVMRCNWTWAGAPVVLLSWPGDSSLAWPSCGDGASRKALNVACGRHFCQSSSRNSCVLSSWGAGDTGMLY